MTDLTGKTIGEYQLIEIIGQTDQSLVYRGFQPSTSRYIAVKVMKPEAAGDKLGLQQFNQLADLSAKLQHPGLIPILESGHEGGVYYQVMPFMAGGTLANKLATYRDSNQALALLKQILPALEYIHGQGYIHGNLKPENILFDEHQRPMLSDYGFTRHSGASSPYLSPEQVQGGPVDKRSDTFALGALLYTMLAGQTPPAGAVVSLRTVRPDLSQEVERVVLKATAQNPDQRYQNAGEFSSALEAALQSPEPAPQPVQAPAPAPYTAPPQPAEKKGTNWLAILLGGALIVVLCLFAYLLLPRVMEYIGAPTEVAEAPPPAATEPPPAPTEPPPGVTVVLPTREERPTRQPVELPTQPPEQPPEQLPDQPPADGGAQLPGICGSTGFIGGSLIFGGVLISRGRKKRDQRSWKE